MSSIDQSHNKACEADDVVDTEMTTCDHHQQQQDEEQHMAESSSHQQNFYDYPPESFSVPKDSVEDWFAQNATMQRKTSMKLGISGGISGAGANRRFKNLAHRSLSTLNQKHKSSSLIALPKTHKSGAGENLRREYPATARLFRSRSEPGGKGVVNQGVEPGSPKVSCTGRVRPKRDKKNRTGLWKKLRSALKGQLGSKPNRVVSKESSESAGSIGLESGRWSES